MITLDSLKKDYAKIDHMNLTIAERRLLYLIGDVIEFLKQQDALKPWEFPKF